MQSNMWEIQRELVISKLSIACWLNVELVKLIFISCNGGCALIKQHSVPIICYIFAFLVSIYISFRQFYANGDYYIGGCRQNKNHGKGEYEWENGGREIAYSVDDKREGKAKYYYKDGREEDRLYKDDERVE